MTAVIIGDPTDSHVVAVSTRLEAVASDPPLIFDAPLLRSNDYSLDLDAIVVAGRRLPHTHGRGWLRRYAPSAWGSGKITASRESLEHRAFLALVGNLSRLRRGGWLTHVDAMLRAEDRLLQLQLARDLGYRVPKTILASSASAVTTELGASFVVKSLIAGYYRTEDGARAVYATELDHDLVDRLDFAAAPCVAQEIIRPTEHLRVVTVRDQGWVARLDPYDHPLDWREDDRAHAEWEPGNDPEAVRAAVALAQAHHVGYSSQDWIRDRDGLVFLDLNPGGQWMFLPPAIADRVSDAIAHFLSGEPCESDMA